MIQKHKNSKMKKCSLLTYLIIITIFTNCVSGKSLERNKILHERQGTDISTTSLDARLTFFSKKTDDERMCLAPPPDALLTYSNNLSLGLNALKSTDNIGDKSGVSSALLAGRAPLVLIFRELMYRACELSLNQKLSKEESIKVYKAFLEIAAKITKDMPSTNTIIKPTDNSSDDDNDDDGKDSDGNV